MSLTDSDLKAIDRYERIMLADCENCDKGSSALAGFVIIAVSGAMAGAAFLFVVLLAAGVIK